MNNPEATAVVPEATAIKPKVIALILAGGQGERFGADRPKQYVELNGESILHHTLSAFRDYTDGIVVVCQNEWKDYVEAYSAEFPTLRTCQAGATGYESLHSGIEFLSDLPDDVIVMIHDAARPLVPASVISRNLEVASLNGNAITVVGIYETLLHSTDGTTACSMTARDESYRAQTPQTFTLGMLRNMFQQAQEKGITSSECACTLAMQLGLKLFLSEGDIINFKITTPSDMYLYETALS